MLTIKKINENKDSFMDLLLLGDEQESMIKKYLYRGELFALYDDDDLKTVSVVTKENDDTYDPGHRRWICRAYRYDQNSHPDRYSVVFGSALYYRSGYDEVYAQALCRAGV